MNSKLVTTYLKFYTKRSVHVISHINVKQVQMFLLVTRNKTFLTKFAALEHFFKKLKQFHQHYVKMRRVIQPSKCN